MNNSSIRGRFSLSTTNLSSPIAESTCLNGHSSRSKFNWGEGNISSRNLNESHHSFADKSSSMSKNLSGTPTKVSMSPSTRIDPRTYVDIHSNGLASRIVKYHDNSTRLNRSLSMGNLYNKPGQFPVVHLKKNEHQYKAKKSKNLSMTRIAAPEKSAFHGNTLSSILRSGSIVGLHKSDEEISRENRPILHPPPTENEMAPTRSVLEVLKEISRKRINSDEIDATELIKKQCKEAGLDTIPFNGERIHSKRQREINSTVTSNVQISPEQQVIKKRICNYNNDIMSSLSSSMLSVNKKRVQQIQSQKRNASDLGALNKTNTSSGDVDTSRSEKQRCIGNFDLTNLASSTKYSPITPLPKTPHESCNDVETVRNGGIATRRASEPVLSNTKPKLTLFNKNYDEEPTNVNCDLDSREDGDLCGIQFVKPKKSSSMSSSGSLLMEKTKKSKLALMLSGLKGELNEEDEIDAAPLAKEQQKTPEAVVPSSAVPSVSDSSTLLSSAKPVVSSKQDTTTQSNPEIPKNSPTMANSGLKLNPSEAPKLTSNISTGFKIGTSSEPSSTPASSTEVPSLSVTTTAAAPITSTLTSKPTAGGFSFGLNKINTTAVATTPTIAQPSIAIPATTSTTTTDNTPNAATKAFSFGLPSASTLATKTATVPSLTFGAPSTLSQPASKESSMASELNKSSTTTIDGTPPVFGQPTTATKPVAAFSFGSPAAASSNSNVLAAATTSQTTVSSTPTFNFGTPKSTWNPTAPPATTNTGSILGINSFGGNASASQSNTVAVAANPSSTGGFSFGLAAPADSAKPSLFGSVNTSTTTSVANSTFSFSASKTTSTPPTNPVNTFTFGSAALPQATANNPTPAFGSAAVNPTINSAPSFGSVAMVPTMNSTSAFGSVAPAQSNQSQSIFGSTAMSKPANTFAFGTSNASAPQKSAFAFSSSDKPPSAAPSTGNSVGGFAFNNPSVSSVPPADANKTIFGSAASSAATAKPAFNFGSASTVNQKDKPPMFGASTNLFGTPAAPSSNLNSSFTFGSSNTQPNNQGPSAIAPNTNPFGTTAPSNPGSGLGAPSGSTSIFGAPSAAVAPIQQSSTFTFGAGSNNTIQETNKSAGGFVFGSSSSIGSNASKPPTDMNKTFVFGDGNTTITAAPPGAPSLFGGSTATNGNNTTGSTDNKMFSFGGATTGSNNTFTVPRQTSNPSPAFSFGTQTQTASPAPDSNNLFAVPTPAQPASDRVVRKAVRRLHKT